MTRLDRLLQAIHGQVGHQDLGESLVVGLGGAHVVEKKERRLTTIVLPWASRCMLCCLGPVAVCCVVRDDLYIKCNELFSSFVVNFPSLSWCSHNLLTANEMRIHSHTIKSPKKKTHLLASS